MHNPRIPPIWETKSILKRKLIAQFENWQNKIFNLLSHCSQLLKFHNGWTFEIDMYNGNVFLIHVIFPVFWINFFENSVRFQYFSHIWHQCRCRFCLSRNRQIIQFIIWNESFKAKCIISFSNSNQITFKDSISPQSRIKRRAESTQWRSNHVILITPVEVD